MAPLPPSLKLRLPSALAAGLVAAALGASPAAAAAPSLGVTDPAANVTAATAVDTAAGQRTSARRRQLLVVFEKDVTEAEREEVAQAVGGEVLRTSGPYTRLIGLPDGVDVDAAVQRLDAREEVASAVPNHVARAAAYMPRDPGRSGVAGGWARDQWNFLAQFGVDAPEAWQNLIDVGRDGGRGSVVAVIDSGVAYRNSGRYRLSPDFSRSQFVRGYDFLRDDPYPMDASGHGTHIAGTIAERTGNATGVTGLAYGARIMPLRVLDADGLGDSDDMARAVRYAARNGADVINLSIEFDDSVGARDIPNLLKAIRYARGKKVDVIAAAGNSSLDTVPYPARAPGVIGVGATTDSGCLANFSNAGRFVDLVAPGGGRDAKVQGDSRCRDNDAGRDVVQFTFRGKASSFGLPDGYEGTSMAAPHVAATAALVRASGVLGADPKPKDVEYHLERTARPWGPRGLYGNGLVDAAAATEPRG